MKPKMINYVCARPILLTWAVGALILDAYVLAAVAHEHSLGLIISNWKTVLWLVAGLLAFAGLGLFFGMFTLWPLIRRGCCNTRC